MSFCGGVCWGSPTSATRVISALLIRIVSCAFLLSDWVYSHSWTSDEWLNDHLSQGSEGNKAALGIHRFILLILLQVKTAVRRVFCSYLSLLVNSKDDMALAQTLDVPSRCLGRQAFTDIKRAAQKSNTSLFLVTNAQAFCCPFASFITVKKQDVSIVAVFLCGNVQALTSFVRAIQLGGKGYAPAESDPLRKHVKGLSDFVHFLDNLEEILGETADPR